MRIPTQVLRHRATISRSVEVWSNGAVSWVTRQVASGEPCLLDTVGKEWVMSPLLATQVQIAESDLHGTLFVGPTSSATWDETIPPAEREVRPSDTLTITTGTAQVTMSVLAAPSRVEGWDGPSHREVRVKEL